MARGKIKVSVIVPVYNVYNYLEKCLNSLVMQTLKDIEIIVVNDGSPDDSQIIIDQFVKKYPKKVISYIKPNGGLSDARNYGIKRANGEYLAFVDSDDYVEVNMYEDMYKKASATSSDVVVCGIYNEFINTSRPYYLPDSKAFGHSLKDSNKILPNSRSYAWNKIYKREWWLENKFVYPIQWYEDSALTYNILLMANKIECVNIPYYHYIRTRENSIVNDVTPKMFDIFKSCTSALSFYKEHGCSLYLREYLENICIGHICARITLFNKRKDNELVHNFIKEARKYLDENIVDWRDNSYFVKSKNMKKMIMHPNLLWYYRLITISKEKYKKFKSIIKKMLKVSKKVQENKELIKYNGYSVLNNIFDKFAKLKIESFLDNETLYNFIKNKQISDKDNNLNIGIIANNKQKSIINVFFQKNQYKMIRTYYVDRIVVGQLWLCDGIYLYINYYERRKHNLYSKFIVYNENNDNWNQSAYENQYTDIKKYRKLKIEKNKFPIPYDYVTFINEKYSINIFDNEIELDRFKKAYLLDDKGGYKVCTPVGFKANSIISYQVNKIINSRERIRNLQLIEFQILKEVDRICKENNITYYLAEGTLLGAIRHHGFIPWDDDLDISMPREDYEKFLKVAPKEINKMYEVQHSTTIKDYWSPFIKVRYLDNSLYSQSHIAHLTNNNGPYIDIFPIDIVPEKISFKQKIQAVERKYLRGMISYKLGLKKPTTKKAKIIKFTSKFVSIKRIHILLNKTLTRYNSADNKYMVNLCSYHYYRNQIVPKEWYGKPRYIKFEKGKFPIPSETKKILNQVYGDYMELPPIEKRVIKHHF